jgi:hypothetical protein
MAEVSQERTMTVPPPEGGALDGIPQSGELKIKERRTWKTWQLLSVALVAAILGMWINGDTGGGGSSSATSSNPDGGKLPAEGAGAPAGSASGGTTTTDAAGGSSATTTTAAGGSSGTTTTTGAGGATTTTVAGGSTTATTAAGAAAGPARVLLLSPQQKGNWTSTAFTTTGAWNIGWAFSCAPAPAGGPSFQVYVTPAGSSASPTGTAAVSETGASGQSVTPQSSLGAQELVVQTTASCSWIVKVTGS